MSGNRLGAEKRAAQMAGLTHEEYRAKRDTGEKRCTKCKQWKPASEFAADASRNDGLVPACRDCKAGHHKATFVPVAPENRAPMGPPRVARRDGDKLQARARINADVRMGQRPDPNTLHCVYCGHIGDDRRHEYHHHLGYAAEHHNDVLPACTTCHRREESRAAA